jgi:lambda repressor-like predicted transcriptional regulator
VGLRFIEIAGVSYRGGYISGVYDTSVAGIPDKTYAEIIRTEARKQKLTLRGLSRKTGFSYEHVRRVLSGSPVASSKFNAAICEALDLDEKSMWALAQREKLARRYIASTLTQHLAQYQLPADTISPSRIVALWQRMSPQDRARVLVIMEGLAQAAEIESDTKRVD